MRDWYDKIDPQIRTEVKLLRNAGINTIRSHGSDILTIDANILPVDGSVGDTCEVLLNAGHRNYVIATRLVARNGYILNNTMHIRLSTIELEGEEEG